MRSCINDWITRAAMLSGREVRILTGVIIYKRIGYISITRIKSK